MTLEELINLEPGEKIIFKMRRHPLIFFGQMSLIAVLFLVPFGAGWIILNVRPDWLIGLASRTMLILLASAFYLNIWMFALSMFTDYYLDAWIITDSRVLDIRQQGLFARTVAELELQKIQDVTSDIKGILPSIFTYGNVHIQTAGEKERFVFEQIPKPHKVRHELVDLVEKNRERKPTPTKAVYNPLNPSG